MNGRRVWCVVGLLLVTVVSTTGEEQPQPPRPGGNPPDFAQRKRSRSNLGKIALAWNNYESVYDRLPSDIKDQQGKLLLSWRVAILPYLGEEKLYRRFNLKEPWDSEQNTKLLAEIPLAYRVGVEPNGATETYFQCLTVPSGGLALTKRVYLGDENNLIIAEVGPPVPWTKPQDVIYDQREGTFARAIELPHPPVLNVVRLDGKAFTVVPRVTPPLTPAAADRLYAIGPFHGPDAKSVVFDPVSAADQTELTRLTADTLAAGNELQVVLAEYHRLVTAGRGVGASMEGAEQLNTQLRDLVRTVTAAKQAMVAAAKPPAK